MRYSVRGALSGRTMQNSAQNMLDAYCAQFRKRQVDRPLAGQHRVRRRQKLARRIVVIPDMPGEGNDARNSRHLFVLLRMQWTMARIGSEAHHLANQPPPADAPHRPEKRQRVIERRARQAAFDSRHQIFDPLGPAPDSKYRADIFRRNVEHANLELEYVAQMIPFNGAMCAGEFFARAHCAIKWYHLS